MLVDSFQRTHDYLRISLTDHCNLRCFYCMPDEEYQFMSTANLMQAEEIDGIASVFISEGIRKIRLTGGEPLVRRDFDTIVRNLATKGVALSLTTNGILLDKHWEVLKEVKLSGVNISLDTLQTDKFKQLAKRDYFAKVYQNIEEAIRLELPVKLNVVAMKGVNEDEVIDFVALTEKYPIQVRFIEFMPFEGNRWKHASVLTAEEILTQIEKVYTVTKLLDGKHETTRSYQAKDCIGTFGIISTMSAPFCAGCNRLRLTADGKMKNCLFSKGEIDLLSVWRAGEDIRPFIHQSVQLKRKELGGQFEASLTTVNTNVIQNRSMIAIGG